MRFSELFPDLESYIQIIDISEIRVKDLPWHTSFFSQPVYQLSIDLVKAFINIDAARNYLFTLEPH